MGSEFTKNSYTLSFFNTLHFRILLFSVFFYLSAYLFLPFYLSHCLPIYLTVCLSTYLTVFLSILLSFYLFIYLSFYLSYCLIVPSVFCFPLLVFTFLFTSTSIIMTLSYLYSRQHLTMDSEVTLIASLYLFLVLSLVLRPIECFYASLLSLVQLRIFLSYLYS